MIRLMRAPDLPPDVPGMLFSDGTDCVVLVNPSFIARNGPEWTREVTNALLEPCGETMGRRPLKAVV